MTLRAMLLLLILGFASTQGLLQSRLRAEMVGLFGRPVHMRTATHSTPVTRDECYKMVGRTHFSRFDCTISGIRGWRENWVTGWCDVDMNNCKW